RAFPGVLFLMDDADTARILLRQFVEDLRRSVGGPIIDGDDFGFQAVGEGGVHGPQDGGSDELFFVIDRNDDGEQPFRGQAVIVPRVWDFPQQRRAAYPPISKYSTPFELNDFKNSLKSLAGAGVAIEGPPRFLTGPYGRGSDWGTL